MNAENLNVTAGTANLQTQVPGAPATVSSAAEVTGGVAAGSFVETDIDDELFQFNSDDTPLMNLMLRAKRVKVNSPEVEHYMIDESRSLITVAEDVEEDGFVFLTGRKKNLIITPNGENVSPEEIENRLGENRLVQEVLVRESGGAIEAEIFPDYEYAGKKKIKDMQGELQKIIDAYNKTAPLYKRVFKLKVRETEFEKNTTKKIKRF